MVEIMLEGGVDEGLVGREARQFVTAVKIDTVTIKEDGIGSKEEIHVHRHHHREEKQRHGTDELIDGLIGNDRERRRIAKVMMRAMLLPAEFGGVAESVVVEGPEVRAEPDDEEGEDVIAERVLHLRRRTPATEGLREDVVMSQPDGNGRAERG